MPASDPFTGYWPSSGTPLCASKRNAFALFTGIRCNRALLNKNADAFVRGAGPPATAPRCPP